MKTGLLLIDIQNDYFSGGKMTLVGINEAAERSAELLATFRSRDLPMFHVRHMFLGENPPFFAPESEGAEIHESVAPNDREVVITKHHPNGFLESSLERELRKAGVERLVICGAMSHMCVDATTRAAADMGFKCAVAHDACATLNLEFDGKSIPAEQVHGSYMSALAWGYAEVAPATKLLKVL